MDQTRRGAFCHDHRKFGLIVGGCAIIAVSLGGCSNFDKHTPQADDRIQLTSADDEIHVGRRAVQNYTCASNLILYCQDWGPTDLACHCVLR